MRTIFRVTALATGLMLFFSLAAQQTQRSLPKVVSASVPFYPILAPGARIQGVVTLRVSTDGKSVSAIDAESGPPMLVQAAKENVRTWRFEPHAPATFGVKFRYRLLDYKCDSDCRCKSQPEPSVLLHLPSHVEVTSVIPMICDPAEQTPRKK